MVEAPARQHRRPSAWNAKRFLPYRRSLSDRRYCAAPILRTWTRFAEGEALRWADLTGWHPESGIPLAFIRRMTDSSRLKELIEGLGPHAHQLIAGLYLIHEERACALKRKSTRRPSARWRASRARRRGSVEGWTVIHPPDGQDPIRIPHEPGPPGRPGAPKLSPGRWPWVAAMTEHLWRVSDQSWRGWAEVAKMVADFDPKAGRDLRRQVRFYRERHPEGTERALTELNRLVKAARLAPPLPARARALLPEPFDS